MLLTIYSVTIRREHILCDFIKIEETKLVRDTNIPGAIVFGYQFGAKVLKQNYPNDLFMDLSVVQSLP